MVALTEMVPRRVCIEMMQRRASTKMVAFTEMVHRRVCIETMQRRAPT
jgi:hypothetical protein